MKKIALAAALAFAPLVSHAIANEPKTEAQMLRQLSDEAELRRIATEIEMAVDRKDWKTARSFFTDTIRVDFTSLVGGEPATIPADGLIQGWSGNLKGNKESLHMRGDVFITINADTAAVVSNGYAYNKMPGAPDGSGDIWEVWGQYTHKMIRTSSGWKVNDFTFFKTHERGSTWVKQTPGS
ncbi:MAG: nuclear transport factor 2 family protein [Rhizobiaceae bacterium]